MEPDGTGLGFAIVKKIIDAHDGGVDVPDNPQPEGVTFRVSLPMVSWKPDGRNL